MKRLVLALLVACVSPKTQQQQQLPPVPLAVTLSDAGNGDVTFTIDNRGANEAAVPSQVLESGTLFLEVRDAKGAVVSGGPPPTPDERVKKIAPGEKATGKVHIDAPPGEYDVKSRLPESTSNTIHVVLK